MFPELSREEQIAALNKRIATLLEKIHKLNVEKEELITVLAAYLLSKGIAARYPHEILEIAEADETNDPVIAGILKVVRAIEAQLALLVDELDRLEREKSRLERE